MQRHLRYLLAMAVAAGLSRSALIAQTYNWSGAGDGSTWSQGANWSGGVAPAPGAYQIFLGTGFPTATPTPIVIGASDNVTLSDQVFGPEWGETLDMYGTVNAGFGFAPVGAIGGPVSTVNMFGNASYTSGDSIFLGDMFWFNGGPNVVMNMYDNSSLTTKYFGWGGHLNLFGGTVTIQTSLLAGTPTAGAWGSPIVTDATRLMNIAGGKLILAGDASASVNDWISRGILEGYGVVGQVSIDTVSDPGWTIVAGVPEPATAGFMVLGAVTFLLRRRSISAS
jgi:hypothetical protein